MVPISKIFNLGPSCNVDARKFATECHLINDVCVGKFCVICMNSECLNNIWRGIELLTNPSLSDFFYFFSFLKIPSSLITEHILWQVTGEHSDSESVAKHHQQFFPKLPSWSLDWQRPHSRTSQRHSRYSQVKNANRLRSDNEYQIELGESITARTESLCSYSVLHKLLLFWCKGAASFRELGPPDLCHVVKTSGRQGAREVGEISSIFSWRES